MGALLTASKQILLIIYQCYYTVDRKSKSSKNSYAHAHTHSACKAFKNYSWRFFAWCLSPLLVRVRVYIRMNTGYRRTVLAWLRVSSPLHVSWIGPFVPKTHPILKYHHLYHVNFVLNFCFFPGFLACQTFNIHWTWKYSAFDRITCVNMNFIEI